MPRKAEWTEDQRRDVSARFATGEGALGIAKSYGFATGKTVVDLLKELGEFEPNRKFQGRFTSAQKAEMVRRYEAGETVASIAKDFGVERTSTRDLLKRRVELRPQGFQSDPEEDSKITELRNQGLNTQEIADLLGISKHWALTRLRAMGMAAPKTRRGPKSNLWKGGRTYRHRTGYLYVSLDPGDPMWPMATSNGQVPEHRLVMGRSLGRPLTRDESVHHINGVKTDNRIENLQLRKGNHGKGVVLACLDCGSHNVGPVPIAA
jgi:transposase-like protein